MNRIIRGNTTSKRRKKYLKLAKGYTGLNSKSSIMATEQIIQSLNYSYVGRVLKKRYYRRLFILRLNIIIGLFKNNNISDSKILNYSSFVGNLKKKNILLNKKMLSFLAYNDALCFLGLVVREYV